MRTKVAAVIIAYNDITALYKCLESLHKQVDYMIIIDNSTDDSIFAYKNEHIYIKNNTNLGLAKALNIGIKKSLELDIEWILLLDQDSVLEKSMVLNMLNSYQDKTHKSEIAQIVPTVYDKNLNYYIPSLVYKTFSLQKISNPKLDCYIDFQITSGSLIKKSIFKELGLMDDSLFIDYIDFDYCFKIRKFNYKILLSNTALLYHQMGEKKVKFGIPFVEHSSSRVYYQMRNRIIIMKRFKKEFPFFIFKEINRMILKFFKILILENDKNKKIKNYFQGISQGVLCR
jgi:rhamnosyltransferase